MPRISRTVPLALAAALTAILFLSPKALAEFPPEKVENLQVLSKDMSVREVIGIMRQFSMGLGVRCQHCHVGEPGAPLSEVDFVSDEKEEKKKARKMFTMTQAINTEHLADLGVPDAARISVQCITCHRGQPRPILLQDLLRQEIAENGVEAAVKRYGELRAEFYGTHSFDFSEFTLIQLGETLFQEQNSPAAETMLKLNLEHFPESGASWNSLAELYRQGGNLESATEAVSRALEINPDDRRAKWTQQQIESGGEN